MEWLEAAAQWAWSNTIGGSALFLLAAIVAVFLREPRHALIRHWLAMLVILRLLLPSAPQSQFSVFNELRTEEKPRTAVFADVKTPSAGPVVRVEIPRRTYWLEIAWAMGAIGVLGRALMQNRAVLKWIARSSAVTDPDILRVLEEAKRATGVNRNIRVHVVDEIATPALFGFLRPRLLLPPSALGENRLRMIFLHELAHVKRRDVVWNWLMIVAQAAHWFNPLSWIAVKRGRADQELLCDQAVMRLLGAEERRSYGEVLLSLASDGSAPPASVVPIFTNHKQLKERIVMIAQFKPATKRVAALGVIIAAALAAITFTRAVEPKQTAAKPRSAAARGEESMKMLREFLNEREVALRQKTAEMDELRNKVGIIGEPSNSESIATLHMEKIRGLWSELSRLDMRIAEREMALEARQKATDDQMVYGSNDPSLVKIMEEREAGERELAAVRKQYDDAHPNVTALTTRQKTIERQIETRVKAAETTMRTGLQTDINSRNRMRAQLEDTQAEYRKLVDQSRPYFRAKRDVEILQNARDQLYIRYLQESVDAKLGRE